MRVAFGGSTSRAFTHFRRHGSLRCHSKPEAAGPFVVVDIPPARESTIEPSAVPVVHSPAYFLQVEEENLLSEVVETEVSEGEEKRQEDPVKSFEENPVDWVLTSTDEMLKNMEKNPDATTETIWKISNSPIGKGTAAGVRTAAKVTLKAGQEAAKMAVPVGTWALKEGVSAVTKILTSSSKKKK